MEKPNFLEQLKSQARSSIEGQKPRWKNFLTRWFVGKSSNQKFTDDPGMTTSRTEKIDLSIEVRTDSEPSWQEVVAKSSLTNSEKGLLFYFISQVLEGDAELRSYAYESFVEKCQPDEVNPITLQNALMDMLPTKEVQRLFMQIPKGSIITVYARLNNDGSSVASSTFSQDLIQKYGLHNPQTEEGEFEKLSQEQTDDYLREHFSSSKPTFEHILEEGVLVAEPLQGYSYGARIRPQDGEDIDYLPDDVTRFIITGVDAELRKRRDREVFPGKLVQIWDSDLHQWVLGKMTKRVFGDTIRVEFDKPIQKKNAFGDLVTITHQDVWVSDAVVRRHQSEFGENSLPMLGSWDFETSPYLFQSIDLSAERETPPYENVPEQFRPGTFVRFSNGTLGLVRRSTSQGLVEIDGVDKQLGPQLRSFDTINWIGFDDTQMPSIVQEIPEQSQHLKGRTVKLREHFLENTQSVPVTMRVRGVFQIEDQAKVVLECLPVWFGINANLLQQRFYDLPLEQFQAAVQSEEVVISDQNIGAELKNRFPEQYEKISSQLSEGGGVVCDVRLKNGQFVSNKRVYFHSLPFGIWLATEGETSPRLVQLEDIKTLEVWTEEEALGRFRVLFRK